MTTVAVASTLDFPLQINLGTANSPSVTLARRIVVPTGGYSPGITTGVDATFMNTWLANFAQHSLVTSGAISIAWQE